MKVKQDYDELLARASEARASAYAPYSGFTVGAALLSEDGRVYVGANIENAAYSACLCAERVALSAAVMDGMPRILAIAVVGGRVGEAPNSPCPPCGVCRQALSELCSTDLVIASEGGGERLTTTLGELLPSSFGGENL